MAYKTSLNGPKTKKGVKGGETTSSLGSLVKLLPTGTVFLFQFLNPLLSNYGECSLFNRTICGGLMTICGMSCFISSFTDSYIGLDGSINYGIATGTGLWPGGDGSVDLSKYRLRIRDFIHGSLSLAVFVVTSFLDMNTFECFDPEHEDHEHDWKLMLTALPATVGMTAGIAFMLFPNNRHGVGYPLDDDQDDALKS